MLRDQGQRAIPRDGAAERCLFGAVLFSQGRYPGLTSKSLTKVIDANVPGDGVHPRQDWCAGTVGVAHLMNTQPGFLQKIFGFASTGSLNGKKPLELWTEAIDQTGRGNKVAPLVIQHQRFKARFRVHGAGETQLSPCSVPVLWAASPP